jgi:hypothetical protein
MRKATMRHVARAKFLSVAVGWLLLPGCGGGGGDGPPPVDPPPDTSIRVRALVGYRPETPAGTPESQIYTRVGLSGFPASIVTDLYYESRGALPQPACATYHAISPGGAYAARSVCEAGAITQSVETLNLLGSPVATTRYPSASADPTSVRFLAPGAEDGTFHVHWQTVFQGTSNALYKYDARSASELPADRAGLGSLYGFDALRAIPRSHRVLYVARRISPTVAAYLLDRNLSPPWSQFSADGADLSPFLDGEFSADGRFLVAAAGREVTGGFEVWGYDIATSGRDMELFTLPLPATRTVARKRSFGEDSLLFDLVSTSVASEVTFVTARLGDRTSRTLGSYPTYRNHQPPLGFIRGNEAVIVTGAAGDRADVFALDLSGLQAARRLSPVAGIGGLTAIAPLGTDGILVTHEEGRRLGVIRNATPETVVAVGEALATGRSYHAAMADPRGLVVVYSLTELGRHAGPVYAIDLSAPATAVPLPGRVGTEYAIPKQVLDASAR